MKEFDQKIHDAFPGLVVRKDLVKEVKGNAIVPSYVLEYLLGQYCATDDQETVKAGIESVKSTMLSFTSLCITTETAEQQRLSTVSPGDEAP